MIFFNINSLDYCFIHIPKTAGTSFEKTIMDKKLDNHNYNLKLKSYMDFYQCKTSHIPFYFAKNTIVKKLNFNNEINYISIVRNPWERLVSLFEQEILREKVGLPKQELEATAFVLGCILQEGERADSPRAIAQAGPRAAVLLHRCADEFLEGMPNSYPVPDSVAEAVNGYIELAKTFEPQDAPWLENHRGHLMFVKESERPFITEALIRETTFTGLENDIIGRVEALRDAGFKQFTVQLTPGNEDAIEDWTRIKNAIG